MKQNNYQLTKTDYASIISISILFAVGILVISNLLSGCGPRDTVTTQPEEEVIDEACHGSFYEVEPNDTLDTANIVAVLPTAGAGTICGRLNGTDDFFYFALIPWSSPTGRVNTNWVLESHSDVFVQLLFFQSVLSIEGTVISYDFLGQFSGSDSIVITDFGVSYSYPFTTVLIVLVVGQSVLPNETYKYELTYWAD